MTIPFNDLGRHYAGMAAELEEASLRVLRGGWYVLGPEVAAFEREWADYCGARHCVSLATGTDALQLAVRALGLGPGDEVLTVANAGSYVAFATRLAGATPRYADVDLDTWTMDPLDMELAITPRTKAIVPVHLYGRLADIAEIAAIAERHGLPLIEDCAQAHGARLDGRHAGTFGLAGCFSFYPTKNLGALGDGGAIITDDDDFAARLRQLRTYGWEQKYRVTVAGGTNSRLDELQAAILRVKLRHLDAQNQRRAQIAARYGAGLADLPLRLAAPAAEGSHVHHLYVIQLLSEQRAVIQAALRERGIGTDIHYPIADHRQPAWAAEYADLRLIGAEGLAESGLSLPCYPELTDSEVDEVIAALRAAFSFTS
ncbi:MAG TPA: DegT/DnrJ/EryC1/StrS family aminotransferase [Herpetosiphonaceae bacterium]